MPGTAHCGPHALQILWHPPFCLHGMVHVNRKLSDEFDTLTQERKMKSKRRNMNSILVPTGKFSVTSTGTPPPKKVRYQDFMSIMEAWPGHSNGLVLTSVPELKAEDALKPAGWAALFYYTKRHT